MRNQNTQLLASASADGKVKIWDTEAGGSPLKCSWGYYGVNAEASVNGKGNVSNFFHKKKLYIYISTQILLQLLQIAPLYQHR